VDIWSVIADRKIQEAIEEGVFDSLEGSGRPLPEDDASCLDPAQRMAHRLMKNAGITPEWIAEGRAIDREIERLQGAAPCDRRRLASELNRRIALFNLKTPLKTSHKMLVIE
jgi:hypothetical protein